VKFFENLEIMELHAGFHYFVAISSRIFYFSKKKKNQKSTFQGIGLGIQKIWILDL
jgi:hypothetical protein